MRDRRKRLLRTASYCVASIITDCIFAIDFSLRFSSFSRPFRDLKRIERGRSPLFFFFLFPSLLFSPSPTRRFPFASKWKHTYLAAFVPSLFPFVFGRAGNGRSLYSRIRTRICASVSRSRRPPLPFIRFLLLFSVSRTEPTMKKRQAISPCAIPNVRTYSNVSTWFSSSRQRSCFHREL